MPPTANEQRLERQRRFAWAKYYEELRNHHEGAIVRIQQITRIVNEPTLPAHLKTEIDEMRIAMAKEYECPICITTIPQGELDITSCGHKYCKECLRQLLARDPKCAVCRKELSNRN